MIDEKWIRNADLALCSLRQMLSIEPFRVEPRWVSESIVTHLSIVLNDVLQLFRIVDLRIDFIVEGDVKDVTDIVSLYRNASCHFGSTSRQMNAGVTVSFMTMIGKGVGIQTPDGALENPFEDDVAYFYGNIRLFHKRHIVRAVTIAQEKLVEIAANFGMEDRLMIRLPVGPF